MFSASYLGFRNPSGGGLCGRTFIVSGPLISACIVLHCRVDWFKGCVLL
jgi:hypothetical protein